MDADSCDGAQRSWIIAISCGHPVDIVGCQFREAGSIADGRFGAPQAVTFEFDAVGIVKKAVEDSVGIGGIADGVMPRRGRKLAGHDGRLAAVPCCCPLKA